MFVIQDSREKTPWNLVDYEAHIACLHTGDYSIHNEKLDKYSDEDLNHFLCLERKKSVSELFSNITTVRFQKCIDRMSKFQHKFLVLEFNFDDVLKFPFGSSIPRSKWRFLRNKAPYILACLCGMSVNYGINVVYAGGSGNASIIASDLIKRCIKSLEKTDGHS